MNQLPYQPTCPACQQILDGYMIAVEEPETPPEPGDITVCSYCVTPLEFTAEQTLRRLDMTALSPSGLRDVRRAVQAVRQFQAFRRRLN
jgi:hypothetical protein